MTDPIKATLLQSNTYEGMMNKTTINVVNSDTHADESDMHTVYEGNVPPPPRFLFELLDLTIYCLIKNRQCGKNQINNAHKVLLINGLYS